MNKIPCPPSFETAYTCAKVSLMKAYPHEGVEIGPCRIWHSIRASFEELCDSGVDAIWEQMFSRGFLEWRSCGNNVVLTQRLPRQQSYYILHYRPKGSIVYTICSHSLHTFFSARETAESEAESMRAKCPDEEFAVFECKEVAV